MQTAKGKTYYGAINLTVQNNSHTQAFLFLQEHCSRYSITAPRVLEVGCSSGYFSAALRDRGAYVHGVEFFSKEALECGRVDALYHGTVEEFLQSGFPSHEAPFDAVILGDVLEHLVNPEDVLRGLAGLLAQNGVIIASVPNVTHLGIRRMLEDGQWVYRKYGLMDETHLRFFSRHSLRKMFIRAGLGIDRSYHVLTPVFEEWASMPEEERSGGALNERDHTFQIVVRASRQALSHSAFSQDMPRNLLFLSPGPNEPCTKLRLIYPLVHYCRQAEGMLRVGSAASLQDLLWADVVIAHRECHPGMLQCIRMARNMGTSIVYDLDDLLYALPPYLSQQTNSMQQQTIRHMLATADRVTCTVEPLRDELVKYASVVHIVPNSIPDIVGRIDIEQAQHPDTPCTLVVASSDTVLADMLMEPLRRVLAAVPETRLLIMGPLREDFERAGLPADFHPRCSPEEFSQRLRSVQNGIGLIPLDDSLFSSCKSPIKFYHYSACGIISIASNVRPYSDAIENGVTGMLVKNTTEDWERSILHCMADVGRRRLMLAKALRSGQKSASPAISVGAWKKVFQNLPKPDERLKRQMENGQV